MNTLLDVMCYSELELLVAKHWGDVPYTVHYNVLECPVYNEDRDCTAHINVDGETITLVDVRIHEGRIHFPYILPRYSEIDEDDVVAQISPK